ncbi:MAG: hypothetical protein U1F76_00575 [Candidatus Competibacteraceae bacterium]
MAYQIKDSRLISTVPLTVEDFERIARDLGCDKRRKIGFVAALTAATPTRVITYRKGKETENIAQPGDFIVTNLLPQTLNPLTNDKGQPDQYVIRANRFSELYSRLEGKESEFGPIFKAKSTVKAIYFPNGFDIVPPWGGQQVAAEGYLFLNGTEVYGCEAQACHETYERIEP